MDGKLARRLIAAAALIFVWIPEAASEIPAPIANTTAGSVSGLATANGGAVFKGIPYADPPVGNLRWEAPQPVTTWTGIRQATAFGHPCAQLESMSNHWNTEAAANSSEDCLYLNVYTPKFSPSAHLPVMLWIHGGAFLGGAGSSAVYDGEHLAAYGVVLVNVNYRLGVFGFFTHPSLTATSSSHSSGNFGLEDQIAALKWVKANIAAFGGDPDNITLFGQSAGGASVNALVTSPLTEGMVRNAIIESGIALRMITARSLRDSEQVGLRFADGKSISDLRAMSTSALLQRYDEFAKTNPPFGPIVDGHVLVGDPMAVFARHEEHPVHLIVGSNAREMFEDGKSIKLREAIQRAFGKSAKRALELYGIGNGADTLADPTIGDSRNQLLTDTGARCGAEIAAARHSASGNLTWEYHFEQSLPGKEPVGAQHSYELPYVFGNFLKGGLLGGTFGDSDRALSNVIMKYWTNFAKTGNPNGQSLPNWPAYDTSERSFVRLSTAYPGNARADTKLRGEICRLYEQNLEN